MELAFDASRFLVDSQDHRLASIENAEQSCQVEGDFRFKIKPKKEHSSGVYHDQDAFTETEPPIESEIWIENVKIEPCSDSDEPLEPNFSNGSDKREERQLITDLCCVACPLCDKTMETFYQIRSHFLRTHNRRDAYVVCCGKKFTRRNRIMDHLSKKFHEIYTCELCSEKFMTVQALSTHLSAGKGWYTCDECPTSFKQMCVFNAHKTCHWKFRCLECEEVFDTSESLSLHTKLLHNSKDGHMRCDKCGRSLPSKESLQFHINSQHLGIKHTFQCKICEQWFKTRQNHKRHMTDFHGPEKDEKAKCEICQKVYSYKRALLVHIRNVHIEAKHECNACGKKFKRMISLKVHQSGRVDGMPFKCYYCELKFKNRACFSVHVAKSHPKESAGNRLEPPVESDLNDTDSSNDMKK